MVYKPTYNWGAILYHHQYHSSPWEVFTINAILCTTPSLFSHTKKNNGYAILMFSYHTQDIFQKHHTYIRVYIYICIYVYVYIIYIYTHISTYLWLLIYHKTSRFILSGQITITHEASAEAATLW